MQKRTLKPARGGARIYEAVEIEPAGENCESWQFEANRRILHLLNNQVAGPADISNRIYEETEAAELDSNCNFGLGIGSAENAPHRISTFELDYYIKHKIEDTGKCGCRFARHSNGDCKLPEKLQYNSDNSDSSLNQPASCRDDTTKIYPAEEQSQVKLGEEKYSCHGLFIDIDGELREKSAKTVVCQPVRTQSQSLAKGACICCFSAGNSPTNLSTRPPIENRSSSPATSSDCGARCCSQFIHAHPSYRIDPTVSSADNRSETSYSHKLSCGRLGLASENALECSSCSIESDFGDPGSAPLVNTTPSLHETLSEGKILSASELYSAKGDFCCNCQRHLDCSLTDESTLSLSWFEESEFEDELEVYNCDKSRDSDCLKQAAIDPISLDDQYLVETNSSFPRRIQSPKISIKLGAGKGRHIYQNNNSNERPSLLHIGLDDNRDEDKGINIYTEAETANDLLSNPCNRGKSNLAIASTSTRNAHANEFAPSHSFEYGSGTVDESMNAVRRIARMSAPSLSSLQYLPSQLESPPSKIKRSKSSLSSSNMDFNGKPIEERIINTISDAKAVRTSREAMQQDESFLNKLCLCNCMARSHLNPQKESNSEPADGAKQAARHRDRSSQEKALKPLANSRIHVKGCPKVEASSETESIKTRKEANVRRKQAMAGEYEKQSPSFLNLLMTPIHTSRNKRKFQSTDLADSERNFKGANSDLGSVSDLVPSALATGKSRISRAGSSSESSYMRTSSVTSADRNLSEASHHDDLDFSRPRSVCSVHESGNWSHRGSYRKFLSPTKLFVPRKNQQECDRDDSTRRMKQLRSNSPHQAKEIEQRSFFSRSLNRFSKRTRSSLGKQPTGERTHHDPISEKNQNVAERSVDGSVTCISPTISIDPGVSTREPCSDSIDSFNDIILPQSRLGKVQAQEAPEIILNCAQDLDTESRLSSNSCDMIRARSFRDRSEKQQDNGQSNGPSPHRPARGGWRSECESEISLERATSLPASPGSYRRHLNRGGRSPRLLHSPIPFQSPASCSTKIEDGLQVCSSEHFEKHIGNIKGSQVDVQKALFKCWINYFCPNLIQRDLVEEMRDGIKLIGLLASLTRDKQLKICYEKLNCHRNSYINRLVITPSSRLKHISNVSIAIDYMRKNLGMKLISLNPMDVVSGNPNVVLGLCWNIILKFQFEQNFTPDLIETPSNTTCSTSVLSPDLVNEDSINSGSLIGVSEEESSSDVVSAGTNLQLNDSLFEAGDQVSSEVEKITVATMSELESQSLKNDHGGQHDSSTSVFGLKSKNETNEPEMESIENLGLSESERSRTVAVGDNFECDSGLVGDVIQRRQDPSNRRPSRTRQQASEQVEDDKPFVSWSVLDWLFSSTKSCNENLKGGKPKRKKKRSSKGRTRGKHLPFHSISVDNSAETSKDDSYIRGLWLKIVRAFRASLSFNLVLLICLAGLCVVPLIQKDACCELTSSNILSGEPHIFKRPT